MDAVFNRGFEEQITLLANISPYNQIDQMLQRIDSRIPLRIDGRLFLIVTVSTLIVIPWSISMTNERLGDPALGRTFFSNHGEDLSADLREIIVQAESQANLLQESAISANLLLSVTASRTVGLRTRALNIWGP
jgi:hypothetical protein